MKIIAIAATDLAGAIGNDNRLLFNCKTDMQHFYRKTRGNAVLMGRKTFESIGKPLEERTNIILSKSPDFEAKGCIVANDLQSVLSMQFETLFVIGGAEIYAQTVPLWNELILTVFDEIALKADAYFPKWLNQSWAKINTQHFKFGSIKGNIFHYIKQKPL